MAEQLAFDEPLRERCAVDADEGRPLGPLAPVVHGLGDQLLPGTALPADQHGGVAPRNLADHLEHRDHLPRVADDVVGPVPVGQLPPKAPVLGNQCLLLLRELPETDGMGDEGRQHREDLDVLVERGRLPAGAFGAQRSDRLVALPHGDADEAGLVALLQRAGSAEKARFGGNGRNDDRDARLDDASRDALAEPVPGALPLVVRQTHRLVEKDLRRPAV